MRAIESSITGSLERANLVAFSVPVWAIGDDFLVRAGNPKALTSYASLTKRGDARLGIIAGQAQHDSARASGISEDQITVFDHQADAIEAVRSGRSMHMRAPLWEIGYLWKVLAARCLRPLNTSREQTPSGKSSRSEHSRLAKETAICSPP
jgi:hypothetical protein